MGHVASITKRFEFSASHNLVDLPDGHQCGRMHGHNYAVEVTLTGRTDRVGFVLDYGALAPFGRFLDESLDHRHLNGLGVLGGMNPTAENLALALMIELEACVPTEARPRIHSMEVAVSETPKTWARVREQLQPDAGRDL